MSCRPSRHQRSASQSVFSLPESFSSFEAPPMEEADGRKTAVQSAPKSSEGGAAVSGPSPPPSTSPGLGMPLKESVNPNKYK